MRSTPWSSATAAAIGHNTDGTGWAWGFERALPQADLRRVVLLGAGGAGSAIAHAALRLGAGALVLVDSDAARAQPGRRAVNAAYGAGARAAASGDRGGRCTAPPA